MQIVLARLDDDQVIIKAGRVDIGETHKFRTVKKPIVCMWANKGTEGDRVKAERFAKAEGYIVFCYENEKDPLGKARRDVAS